MAVIPIKLVRTENPRKTRVIEWRLSNICNFNCSFCEPEFKDGSKRYFDYSVYTDAVDSLFEQNTGKATWIQFTGGEPSLYPKLIDLLAYIKDKGGYTSMISNGSRTVRWWKELAELNLLDRLYLSHHPEQDPDPTHTIEVNEIMQATNTLVTVFVTAQCYPELFQRALDNHQKILQNATTISSLKVISGPTELQPYTAEQLKILQENLYVRSAKWTRQPAAKFAHIKAVPWYQSQMEMEFSDGTKKVEAAQYFIEHQLNNFKGWDCDIGKDLLVVEVDEVYRAICREGGVVARVGKDKIQWQTEGIVCGKDNCNCGIDVQEPKIKR